MQQVTWSLPEGLELTDVARPETPEEISTILRDATASQLPVIPVGGGTSLATGHAVDSPFLGIDVRGLRGVREYAPADLTASFHAGTTLDEVISTLAEHGQELPVDTPQSEQATIGGLVATGFSGPRRLGSGSLKDLLIGCAYVRGDGLIAKAGGMLVKNVSGFEISRLMHGSWGALAVLTSVNLKVIPKAKADFSFHQSYQTLEEALAAQMLVLERHPLFNSSVIEREEDGWSFSVRLLGREGSLRSQVTSISDDLGSGADLTEDARYWTAFNNRWAVSSGDVRVVIGARPHQAPDVARALARIDGLSGMAISVPTGSVRISIDPEVVPWDSLASYLQDASRVVESAPVAWKRQVNVWGPDHPANRVMRSIKQEFDPAGVLNRGRLVV